MGAGTFRQLASKLFIPQAIGLTQIDRWSPCGSGCCDPQRRCRSLTSNATGELLIDARAAGFVDHSCVDCTDYNDEFVLPVAGLNGCFYAELFPDLGCNLFPEFEGASGWNTLFFPDGRALIRLQFASGPDESNSWIEAYQWSGRKSASGPWDLGVWNEITGGSYSCFVGPCAGPSCEVQQPSVIQFKAN